MGIGHWASVTWHGVWQIGTTGACRLLLESMYCTKHARAEGLLVEYGMKQRHRDCRNMLGSRLSLLGLLHGPDWYW